MAAHDGPACFFDCGADAASAGGARSQGQPAAALPSGIVCSASLGGGGGAPGSRFVSLPRGGYSFSAWVRLEDGREAAEQLRPPAPAASSTQHAPEHAAAAAAAAAAGSDQALYALLHQQQPTGSHGFLHAHHHAAQPLQGVALAVRRLPPPPGSGGAGALQLVAHSWSPKHAEAPLALQAPLVPGRWHHVALTHASGGALSHPSLHLYLDGQLQVRAACSSGGCACPGRPSCAAWHLALGGTAPPHTSIQARTARPAASTSQPRLHLPRRTPRASSTPPCASR